MFPPATHSALVVAGRACTHASRFNRRSAPSLAVPRGQLLAIRKCRMNSNIAKVMPIFRDEWALFGFPSQARATRGEAAALVRSTREGTEWHLRISCGVHARGTSRSARPADRARPSQRGGTSVARRRCVSYFVPRGTCEAWNTAGPR